MFFAQKTIYPQLHSVMYETWNYTEYIGDKLHICECFTWNTRGTTYHYQLTQAITLFKESSPECFMWNIGALA